MKCWRAVSELLVATNNKLANEDGDDEDDDDGDKSFGDSFSAEKHLKMSGKTKQPFSVISLSLQFTDELALKRGWYRTHNLLLGLLLELAVAGLK